MKKFLCILGAILTVTLVAAFVGCDKDGGNGNAGKSFVGEWEAISLTEIGADEEYTYDMPEEMGVTLTVSKDGTFTINGYYGSETVENWITGKWSQSGDNITLSNIVDSESDADENRYTVKFIDANTIEFTIEVEVFQEIKEGTSYTGTSYTLVRK